MQITYNIPKIEQLLTAVSTLTGISIAFLNPEGEFLCSCTRENDFCSKLIQNTESKEKCRCSDDLILKQSRTNRKFECHICHEGLYDAAIPMIKNGIYAGSVIMGRIRSSASPQVPFQTQDPRLIALYLQTPLFTDEQLESLRILLPNILFESAIEMNTDPLLQQITDYIQTHLDQELKLPTLCSRFHISKNALYDLFRAEYHCTVNEYITDKRIALAKTLLNNSKDPVYLIADKTGLGNYTYFNKLFKKITGMSPMQYRRTIQS